MRSETDNYPGKSKIPLVRGGGRLVHQGPSRSQERLDIFLQGRKKDHLGRCPDDPYSHPTSISSLLRSGDGETIVWCLFAQGGVARVLGDGRGWKALVAPRCKVQQRMLLGSPSSIASSCCLGPGCSHCPVSASPQETPRLQPSRDRTALVGRLWLGEEMNFQRISFTWKGHREHNSDLEVWRLFKGARTGRWRRLYWRKNRDAGLFRCKRFLGLLSLLLRTAATPKPDAHSQQTPKCRAVCRPRRQASRQPLGVLSSLQQNYDPQAERIVGCPFRARSLHPASGGPGLSPPDQPRIPQDHRVRRRHSLQLRISTSRSLCPHLPGAVRSRRPPPPLGRSARLPGPSHQLQSAPLFRGPQTGGGAGPGRGRSARKVSASGTSSSPRASESLHNFVSGASKSALLSARAHTHTFTHTVTRLHTRTLPRIRLQTTHIAWD